MQLTLVPPCGVSISPFFCQEATFPVFEVKANTRESSTRMAPRRSREQQAMSYSRSGPSANRKMVPILVCLFFQVQLLLYQALGPALATNLKTFFAEAWKYKNMGICVVGILNRDEKSVIQNFFRRTRMECLDHTSKTRPQ